MFEILTLISLLAWLYLLFFYSRKDSSFNGLFWRNKILFENEKVPNKKLSCKVCVIIPARNEEKIIAKTLKSISEQNFKNLSVLVIDDNSKDKTSYIARNTLQKAKNLKFFILKGKKLPTGWSGKVWALKQGIDYIRKKQFTHYLFVDSDIQLQKNIIYETLNYLEHKKLSMLSLMAKLNCSSFWEKLLIPSFIFFFQKLYPFSRVNDSDDSLAAAAGGFILCDAKVFRKTNLYNNIKNKVIDDCNLAKTIKPHGKIWLGLTNKVVSKRTYFKLSEIWKMVSRTAFEQLDHSILNLCFSILGMFIIYLFPLSSIIICLIDNFSFFIFLNFLTLILIISSYIPTVIFYKINFIYFFSLPLSSIFYMMMTINSAFNYYLRKGNIWKGRKY